MKKKIILIICITIPLLVLAIFSPYIIKRIRDYNVKDPIITNVEFSDDIECYNGVYQLTSHEKYVIYFEAKMTRKTYKRNPFIFFVSPSQFEVIEDPIEISMEKFDSKNVKVRYKMNISFEGEFQNIIRFDFVWNLAHSNNRGVYCKNEKYNSLSINVTYFPTIDVNFYHINKLLFTYKAKKGETLSDILYDGNISLYNGSNISRLLNKVLNDELKMYFRYVDDTDFYCLENLGFKGWISSETAYSTRLYENINVYSSFENNGDYNYIYVDDMTLIKLYDYYFSPGIYINLVNYGEEQKQYINNINYTLYSESDIVVI